jgi:hypothetical protein
MAKLAGAIGSAVKRYVEPKRTKSERNKPNRKPRKPYRGQGRV